MRLLLLFFILPLISEAISIQFKKDKKMLIFQIKEIPLNVESLDKNLKSGISNHFIAKLSLFVKQKEISKSQVQIKVIYDLWDEIFNLKITNSENSKELKLKNLSEVKEYLSSFSFPFTYEKATSYQSITANFEFIQDPFTKEKQKKIKTWIAENRVNMPTFAAPQRSLGTPNIMTPPSNDSQNENLVNSMLDSELSKDSTEGSWKFTYEFTEISMSEIKNEK